MQPLQHFLWQKIIIGAKSNCYHNPYGFGKIISDYQPGGIILFDRNISNPHQLTKLISQAKHNCQHDIWVSIDQEGGEVQRLKCINDFQETPAPFLLGQQPIQACIQNASLMARQLRALGINLNFFPTIDVAINPNNPIITKRNRAFSTSPHLVTQYAQCFLDRFRFYKVAACLKHFPGHGNSTYDTHNQPVNISETWQARELIPYRDLLYSNDCPFLMLSHLFHNFFDEKHPVSLSKNVIQNHLRKKLNYQGLIISDDLQMKAITCHYDLVTAIKLTVNAGADLLIFGNNVEDYDPCLPKKIDDAFHYLLSHNLIDVDQLYQSNQRLLAYNLKYK